MLCIFLISQSRESMVPKVKLFSQSNITRHRQDHGSLAYSRDRFFLCTHYTILYLQGQYYTVGPLSLHRCFMAFWLPIQAPDYSSLQHLFISTLLQTKWLFFASSNKFLVSGTSIMLFHLPKDFQHLLPSSLLLLWFKGPFKDISFINFPFYQYYAHESPHDQVCLSLAFNLILNYVLCTFNNMSLLHWYKPPSATVSLYLYPWYFITQEPTHRTYMELVS